MTHVKDLKKCFPAGNNPRPALLRQGPEFPAFAFVKSLNTFK
jgi:hypothetical protein